MKTYHLEANVIWSGDQLAKSPTHVALDIAKTAGKISGMIADAQHAGKIDKAQLEKAVANLVVYAVMLADAMDFDINGAITTQSTNNRRKYA